MTALLVAMCVWASLVGDTHQWIRTDAGGKIGGHFSQTGAKTIDALCGAILAPLIVTALNYVWFTSARRHTINDIQSNHRGVPLQSLVAVSTSDSGSYNIFAMKTMIRGRTWRLGLLALLIFVAALAKTTLSNVIAYEAYTEAHRNQQNIPLRQLADPYISNPITNQLYEGLRYDDILNLTSGQRARMAADIAQLLTDITYQGSNGKLENDGTYVGTNLTKVAMRNAPKNITSLFDVPGYKIAVECHTDQSAHNLTIIQMGSYKTSITLFLNSSMFQARYPGPIALLQTGNNDQYAFAAFRTLFPPAPDAFAASTMNVSDVFLGWMTSFNLSREVIPSPYGDIRPIATNATEFGFTGTKTVLSHWGIFCALKRQEGLLNYTRGASNGDNGGWVLNGSIFDGPKTNVPSYLAQWQLQYRTPDQDLPGVGTPLSRTAYGRDQTQIDYQILAQNFLFASAEIERIMHEVAATRDDDQLGPHKAPYFHETACSTVDEYYRITYVPALLLLGVTAILAATAIAAGMAVFGGRAERTRAVHQVHPLRLLVDFASALQRMDGEDGGAVEPIRDIASLPDKELEAWAARYRIIYQRAEKDENVQLELVRVDDLNRSARPFGTGIR